MTVEELRKILADRPNTDRVFLYVESGDGMAVATDVDDRKMAAVWINARSVSE